VIFQNENLVAKSIVQDKDGKAVEKILAVVPDIISLVDTETGKFYKKCFICIRK
jgi:hypothetical protein